jgi:manganese oxidase
MRLCPRLLLLTLVAMAPQLLASSPSSELLPRIELNDNHQSAGRLKDGLLKLALVADQGLWYPAGEDEPGIPVQAFRVAAGPLQIPGPLIRVPAGTVVNLSVRNAIAATTLTLHGLVRRPDTEGRPDALAVNFADTREIQFRLDAPGTYYYWGSTSNKPLEKRYSEDSQLSGAIIVDPPGAVPPANEEIFVVGIWVNIFRDIDRTQPFVGTEMAVINGRSWPQTQRFAFMQGETIHWRWINAAFEGHPLHLHGFYFRVDSRGDAQRDNVYSANAERDMVVTERLDPGATRTITWVADRPGNWLFHCHNPFHFRSHFPLPILLSGHFPERRSPEYESAFESTRDMGGMVLSVAVHPKEHQQPAAALEPRKHLVLTAEVTQSVVARADENTGIARAYRYVLGDTLDDKSSARAIGPPIVLVRGEPVSITVRNHLPEATAVHWHGIELENYYDGVAGIGTDGVRVSPMIEPGQSFDVRLTPPRAGTFIYHTHMNDLQQVLAGLSGPLIVLDGHEAFDPARDHIVFITQPHSSADEDQFVLVNGLHMPESFDLVVGIKHRFRIVNFHTFMANLRIEMREDAHLLSWRALAKDGRDLPEDQRTVRPAQQVVSIGETYDFEFVPDKSADARLEIYDPIFNKIMNVARIHISGD